MKHFFLPGLVAVLLLGSVPLAWGDIPSPFPKPPKPGPFPPPQANTKFVVEINNKVTQATLFIPRKLLANPAGGFRGEIQQGALSPTSTIMAGVCLSLAAMCGGIWVMRRKQRKLAPVPLMVAVGLLAALAVASVAGSFVWANGGVPPKFHPNNGGFNPNNFNPNNGGFNPNFNPNVPQFGNQISSILLTENVQVVVSPTGNQIKLVINQAMLNRLKNTPVIGNPAGVGNPPPVGNPPAPGSAPGSDVGSAPPPGSAPPVVGNPPPSKD